MILTDADELREALRVALQERDEARVALCAVAERQREACAERFRPSKAALVFYKRREAEEIVRSTPLVTDTKADGGTP